MPGNVELCIREFATTTAGRYAFPLARSLVVDFAATSSKKAPSRVAETRLADLIC